MSDGLKPCPSCGPGTAVEEFHPLPDKYPSFPAVICRECGMRGPRSTWNVRKPGPDRGTIDDLRRFNAMARKLAAARADVSRLVAALRRWTDCDGGGGEHLHGCGSADGDPCDCGLEEARDIVAEFEADGGGGQGGDPLAR